MPLILLPNHLIHFDALLAHSIPVNRKYFMCPVDFLDHNSYIINSGCLYCLFVAIKLLVDYFDIMHLFDNQELFNCLPVEVILFTSGMDYNINYFRLFGDFKLLDCIMGQQQLYFDHPSGLIILSCLYTKQVPFSFHNLANN